MSGKLTSTTIKVPVEEKVQMACKVIMPAVGYKPAPKHNEIDIGILFVHPWGKLGGRGDLLVPMAWKTIQAVAPNHPLKTIAAFVVDCRGVGKSNGSGSWGGSTEVQDLGVFTATLSGKATNEIPFSVQNWIIVGSSAGAAISGSALPTIQNAKSYVAIGYPLGWTASIMFSSHYKHLKDDRVAGMPKMFLQGSSDGFTSPSTLKDHLKKHVERDDDGKLEVVILDGLGHFELESQYPQIAAEHLSRFFELHELLN